MKCNNCGSEISDDSKFCPICGCEIETPKSDSKINKLSKKSIISISIIAILFILIFSIQSNSTNKKVEAFASKLDDYEDMFSQYNMYDEMKYYEELMAEGRGIVKDKDIKKINGFLTKLDKLDKDISERNKSELELFLKELGEKDISRALDEEIEEINSLTTEINDYIKNKKFIAAYEKLDELGDIVREVSKVNDNLDISIEQVDTSEYPKIKLYLNVKDRISGEVIKNLDPKFFYLSEKLSEDSSYIKREIEKVVQLDEKESLNINMVADVSGSMDGSPLEDAKYIMSNFLDSVQFGIGDMVELTVFSDGVYTLADFTQDKQLIIDQIHSLYTGDMTSLYDALFAAVNKTAIQNGAKCVIAFTDGLDNYSQCSPQVVLDVANRYNIPIFIIGIGDSINEEELIDIATKSNGFYENVSYIDDMGRIYNDIYRKNKELYLLEYQANEPKNTFDTRNIKIDLQTRNYGGFCEFSYEPHILLSVDRDLEGLSDIDNVVGRYLNGFVNAINSNDYSYLEDVVIPNGPLYDEVEPYIHKNIKEKLLSYEVIDKNFKDDNTCIVTVHETYEIQNQKDPLHMRTLESQYVLKKESDGKWRFYAFNDKIKILSKINS